MPTAVSKKWDPCLSDILIQSTSTTRGFAPPAIRLEAQPLEGVGLQTGSLDLWKAGEPVNIAFIDDSPPVSYQEKVREIAGEWTQHANLKFEYVDLRDGNGADITISFAQKNRFFSYLGTECRSRTPSMVLGFQGQPRDAVFRAQILHEFGHALGLYHEHSHPESGITWLDPEVFTFFSRIAGWSRQQTLSQIEALENNPTKVLTTPFDKDSVMIYEFPAWTNRERISTNRKSELSAGDKKIISMMYPGPNVPRFTDKIKVGGETVKNKINSLINEPHPLKFEIAKNGFYRIVIGGDMRLQVRVFGPNDGTNLQDARFVNPSGVKVKMLLELKKGKYILEVSPRSTIVSLDGSYDVSISEF